MKYDGHDVEAGLGNIYVGVARCLSQVEETVSAILYGVYIPTLDSHSSVYGTHYQEPPAYFNQTISLSMSYRYHRVTRRGFIFGLDVGADLAIPKSNAPDIILHYGFSGGFRFRALAVVAELCGIRWLGGGLRPFGDELRNHSIAIGAELRSGSFQPAVFYQTRLDEEPWDGFDGVLGLQCAVIFG